MFFQTIVPLLEHKEIAETSSHSSFHTVHSDQICQAQFKKHSKTSPYVSWASDASRRTFQLSFTDHVSSTKLLTMHCNQFIDLVSWTQEPDPWMNWTPVTAVLQLTSLRGKLISEYRLAFRSVPRTKRSEDLKYSKQVLCTFWIF